MWSSPKKPAPEAEAKRHARLRLKVKRAVVEFELVDRVPQILVLLAVAWKKAAENHWLRLSITGESFGSRMSGPR